MCQRTWSFHYSVKGEKMRNIICFHNPEEPNGYLSNWYLSNFVINGKRFLSMEQYMMYEKAVLFNDLDIAEQIMSTDKMGKIKILGRSVQNYQDSPWNGRRQIIVYRGLVQKFKQNEELLQKLLSTEDAILAECAVQDQIWGIGRSMKDGRRMNIQEWNGQNLLGYALMEVRRVLREEN